ncbi:hypothetical protein PAGU2196_09460 [Pseudomonas sp. PAGU 2196]|nr:hypothetical protein PAGU2196_09460 [Pseudomonas sp. PAGU 2196]
MPNSAFVSRKGCSGTCIRAESVTTGPASRAIGGASPLPQLERNTVFVGAGLTREWAAKQPSASTQRLNVVPALGAFPTQVYNRPPRFYIAVHTDADLYAPPPALPA